MLYVSSVEDSAETVSRKLSTLKSHLNTCKPHGLGNEICKENSRKIYKRLNSKSFLNGKATGKQGGGS